MNCKTKLPNQLQALFEPTLDYVIVKIPRWNFDKLKELIEL
jgi:carbamoyl-phosphate synthase large subunit